MNNLIVDAAKDEIILTLIANRNIYTSRHENSKMNFDKIIILINDLLKINKKSFDELDNIYANIGPGSFSGIRNSLSVIKALFLTKKIDYYCFSFSDFNKSQETKYEDVPYLCKKFKIKKNLINPAYLS